MVGHFYIDIKEKKVRVRLPTIRRTKDTSKNSWFMNKMGLKNFNSFYDKRSCEWVIPLTKKTVKRLVYLGFDTEAWTFNYLRGPLDKSYYTYKLKPETKFLRKFQSECVKYMVSKKGRVLMALDPGLGKTPTALAYSLQVKDAFPILVICPATVKEQWANAYKQFIGEGNVKVLYGRDSIKGYDNFDMLVVNYELIAYHVTKKKQSYKKDGVVKEREVAVFSDEFKEFINNNFNYMIIDECHYIKDVQAKSKSYKAVRKLGKKIPYIAALSGTPFENTPAELFNVLEILRPDKYKNRMYFYERYCGPEDSGFGVKYTKATLVNELNRNLQQDLMFRRKKENVLRELPPTQASVIPIKLEKHSEYKAYKKDLEAQVKDPSNKLIAANKFEKLLQKAYELKESDVFSFIDDELLKKDKIVVFCWHTKTIQNLMDRYGEKAVKIDGSTPANKRQGIKQAFVTDPKIKLFIGNIISAGTGLDGLQKVCDTMVFAELTWKSTRIDQAIDRISRMGFAGDHVLIYYLIAKDTIEEDLSMLIDKKRKIFDKVIDLEETDKFDLIEELMKLDKYHIEKD